jgi:hypothetical protein
MKWALKTYTELWSINFIETVQGRVQSQASAVTVIGYRGL